MSRKDWPVVLDEFGCWLWQKYVDKRDGRALTWRGGKPYAAYREVYEREVGPIPPDRVMHHACGNAQCVAPHHLEPVTKSVNEERKHWRRVMRVATCPRGHDLRLNSVVTGHRAGRVCRQCNRDSEASQPG